MGQKNNEKEKQAEIVKTIDDSVLLSEVKRRGLNGMIHDGFIREFMSAELMGNYDFSEKDAKEAAQMAFDHYVNTEGASQYDGIEWVVEHWQDLWKKLKQNSFEEMIDKC